MSSAFFAVVPAAGTGNRFGSETPKQYLLLNGVPLIRQTLHGLLSDARICRIVVVLSPNDARWGADCLPEDAAERVHVVRTGGATRADSVFNGISELKYKLQVHSQDWVLVHDAARPCLTPSLLGRLLDNLADDPVGGLLAIPVADTLKHADAQTRVSKTVDRRCLWQAQTPQMFRLDTLQQALATADLSQVTDEASAVEQLGLCPKLVPGSMTNLKVTYPEDLALAELILSSTTL